MATTNVPTPLIDQLGYHTVAFADVLAGFTADYQSVYGGDVILAEDTQDGMWISAQALAYKQACDAGAATYAAFRPSQAQGTGLDTVVKVNGIAREVATASTVSLVCVGTVGVTVAGGVVGDGTNAWTLPTFTFPPSGQATVTATCSQLGATTAPAGAVSSIATPTKGWVSATNPSAATPGAPIELDQQLRVRQTQSVALPSVGLLGGLVGAVLAVPGVAAVAPYENDGDVPDANGVPGRSIALVVTGGDDAAVAQVIALKKGICGTYGTTAIPVTDQFGITRVVRFFRPAPVVVTCNVVVAPGPAYNQSAQNSIMSSVAAYVSGLVPGSRVSRYLAGQSLPQSPASYLVEEIDLARDGKAPTNADLVLAFYEQPVLVAGNVTVSTTT